MIINITKEKLLQQTNISESGADYFLELVNKMLSLRNKTTASIKNLSLEEADVVGLEAMRLFGTEYPKEFAILNAMISNYLT